MMTLQQNHIHFNLISHHLQNKNLKEKNNNINHTEFAEPSKNVYLFNYTDAVDNRDSDTQKLEIETVLNSCNLGVIYTLV